MIQAVYDKELANVGKRRIHVSEVVQVGNTLATVVREKVVKLSDVKPNPAKPWWKADKVRKKGKARMSTDNTTDVITSKAPRASSKLAKAVELVQATGKDDKESCLQAIVSALAVTRGNASIYYAKAKAILG